MPVDNTLKSARCKEPGKADETPTLTNKEETEIS